MNDLMDIGQWFLLGAFCGAFAYQVYLMWLADRDYERRKKTGRWDEEDE